MRKMKFLTRNLEGIFIQDNVLDVQEVLNNDNASLILKSPLRILKVIVLIEVVSI